MAAIRLRSTFGATATKYWSCFISDYTHKKWRMDDAHGLLITEELPRIEELPRNFGYWLAFHCTGWVEGLAYVSRDKQDFQYVHVISALRSNQSPLTSSSTSFPSAAFLKVTTLLLPMSLNFPETSKS